MELMRGYPDKHFSLCIADPPFGIGISSNPVRQAHKKKDWDKAIPTPELFAEMFRVSQNQIIWGGNYFDLPPTPCFVIWDKVQPEEFSMAMCEFAWTSFKSPAKIFKQRVVGADDVRIHPTQKSVRLYDFLLHHYAKEGDTILDPFVGSGSSRIAAHRAGLDFIGAELDPDYWAAQEKRYREFKSQLTLF
jgi:site-specific DNA-methyltransferase (adenine-specific)